MKHIWDFADYKDYLNSRLDEQGRGSRSRLSEEIAVQTAYTAQVLKGRLHFSLEQAEGINKFFAHNEDESNFFIQLVMLGRAGSTALRSRVKKNIDKILEERLLLKNRLKVAQSLDVHNQVHYYSHWYYVAVHVLVSINEYQTTQEISKRLGLEVSKVTEILEFLVKNGLVVEGKLGFEVGQTRIHLGSDSPLIARHHTNWRMKAIQSLERNEKTDLHYSSIVSLSERDFLFIREELARLIEKVNPVIADSKEEIIACVVLDLFQF